MERQYSKDATLSGENELQFGSLDFTSVSCFGGPRVQNQPCSPKQQSRVPQSFKQVLEDKQVTMRKSVITNNLLSIPAKPVSNGVAGDFESKVEDINMDSNSSSVSGNVIVSREQLTRYHIPLGGNCTLGDSAYEEAPTSPAMEGFSNSSAKQGHANSLCPRGLINSGNLCFLNATLQALLACSPFVQLLQELRLRNIPKVGYTTARAFVEFISDLDMPTKSNLRKDEMSLETATPFCPFMFDPVLKKFTPDIPSVSMSGRPRQEDAQEFLSFIMDQLHNELLKLEGRSPNCAGGTINIIASVEDEDWEIVGPKNKSTVTRTQSFIPSPLSDIFGGQLRSIVKARGNKASATIQPYLLLHLDIFPEAVHTIENALSLFSAPETLEGYKTSMGKAGVVSASKSVKLQTLSKIMILHLMRFSYGSKGSTKLHKPVHFPLELVLGRELLVSQLFEGRRYELVATVTHHGREPSKGHYTADVKHSDGRWLRYDDASVTVVGPNRVLHDQAYVLFYRQLK